MKTSTWTIWVVGVLLVGGSAWAAPPAERCHPREACSGTGCGCRMAEPAGGEASRSGHGPRAGMGQRGLHRGGGGPVEGLPALAHGFEAMERSVEEVPGGVRTTTLSKDPELVPVLRAHVRAMKERLETGRPVRQWDPLFVALFERGGEISMVVRDVPGGVEVVETSENPEVVPMLRAHARKVSRMVEEGPAEVHRSTPWPPPEGLGGED